MNIEGAGWSVEQNLLTLNNEGSKSLNPILFTWLKVENRKLDNNELMVPVYLNKNRKNLIFSLKMKCDSKVPKELFYQKAVALIAWNE